jgi:membrane-associated protease RseP (regulator of RpoE activity)
MRAIVLVIAFATAGCASITAGTTESIAVSTMPRAGASCELANEKGRWTVNPTPGSTTISKAYGDLTVTCADPDGEQGATTIQSSTAGAAFGNILLGGIIGAAVDMSSGAAYLYPSNVTVTLAPMGGGSQVAPPPALPSHATSTVAAPLSGSATVRRNFGIRALPVSASLASSLQLIPPRGLSVVSVFPGGAASDAGIKAGDVILAVGGAPMMTISDLQDRLGATSANATVSAEVRRGPQDLSVQLQF